MTRSGFLAPRTLVLALLLTCALPAAHAAEVASTALQPSSATYDVEFRGIDAGSTTFTLSDAGNGQFAYESRSNAKGLAKLVIRTEVREASTFGLVDGVIRPVSYVLDDGSKDTSRDTRLEFDWTANVAKGQHEDHPVEVPLAPGLQDRMSMQIAVMEQLAAGVEPTRIDYIDRNVIKHYVYTKEGTARLKTAVGEVDTVIYSSTREGSTRVSKLWYAPSLGYTPVRGEQLRRGKVETVLTITSLKRS